MTNFWCIMIWDKSDGGAYIDKFKPLHICQTRYRFTQGQVQNNLLKMWRKTKHGSWMYCVLTCDSVSSQWLTDWASQFEVTLRQREKDLLNRLEMIRKDLNFKETLTIEKNLRNPPACGASSDKMANHSLWCGKSVLRGTMLSAAHCTARPPPPLWVLPRRSDSCCWEQTGGRQTSTSRTGQEAETLHETWLSRTPSRATVTRAAITPHPRLHLASSCFEAKDWPPNMLRQK